MQMRLLIITISFCLIFGTAALSAEPLEIMFVLDNSGSMKLNDPQFHTGKFVAEFIEDISLDARVGMLVFDQDVRVILPLTSVMEPDIRQKVNAGLSKLDYRGQWTCSAAAIERALYELKHSGTDKARRIIVFLTDGLVDTGDPKKDKEKSTWLEDNLTADAQKNRVRLFCIAFTEAADYQLLQILAQKTNGEYYRAMQIGDIQTILASINAAMVPTAAPPTADTHEGGRAPQPSTAELFTALLEELNSKTGLMIAGFVFLCLLLMILIFRRRKPAVPPIIVAGGDGTGRGFAMGDSKPKSQPAAKPPKKKMPEKDTPIWTRPKDDSAEETDPPYQKKSEPVSDQEDESKASGPPAREPTHPIPTRGGHGSKLPPAVLEDLSNVTGQTTYNLVHPTIRIGRSAKLNDIVIPERTVSKQHAVIEFKNNMFYLIDMRSANGTCLNHRRFSDPGKVTETPLKNADRITFDVFEFQFMVDDGKSVDRTLLRAIDYPIPQKSTPDPETPVLEIPDGLEEKIKASIPESAMVETTDTGTAAPVDTTVAETSLLSRDMLKDIAAGGITDDLLSEDDTFMHDDSRNKVPESDEITSCYNHPEKIGKQICDICAHNFCNDCIDESTAGCVCTECARLI